MSVVPMILHPRADLLKCAGAGLPACALCTRGLVPAAEANQRWVEAATDASCGYFADVAMYGHAYVPMSEEMQAALEEDRQLRDLGRL